ncbi:hypothetical protein K7432_010169 [Basidiobolus ranarum]|uniref:Fucosyltransferase N-terminal domain-containing protein n=1 Tax=Basidiobolus ranarum TaxID=34480 RepID=A0ABR2VW24_9FUNG
MAPYDTSFCANLWATEHRKKQSNYPDLTNAILVSEASNYLQFIGNKYLSYINQVSTVCKHDLQSKILTSMAAETIPIYYYTKYYGTDKYEEHKIDYCNLAYTCTISHKDTFLKNGTAKAVMFHSSDIQRKKHRKITFPPNSDNPVWDLPWVLHSNESPINENWELNPALLRLFTYRMEYKLNSDFPIPYIPSDSVEKIQSNTSLRRLRKTRRKMSM